MVSYEARRLAAGDVCCKAREGMSRDIAVGNVLVGPSFDEEWWLKSTWLLFELAAVDGRGTTKKALRL
jgi:hypothetical protein